MNIIFNTPYLSNFNAIELAFRNLKKNLYSRIHEIIDKVIEYASNFLETMVFKKSLVYN